MKLLGNLKIGTRLILAFLIAAAITAVAGTLGIVTLSQTYTQSETLYRNYGMAQGYMGSARMAFMEMRIALRDQLLEPDVNNRASYSESYQANDATIDEMMTKVKATIATEETLALYDKALENLQNYRNVRDQVEALALAGKNQEALALLQGDAVAATAAADASLDELFSIKVTNGEKRLTTLEQTTETTRMVLIIVVAVSVLVALGLGLLVSRSIVQPITKVVSAAERIAAGDLSVQLDTTRRDETGVLARAFLQVIHAFRALLADADQLTDAAVHGALLTRADTNSHQGAFRQIIEGMNGIVETLVGHFNRIPTPFVIKDLDCDIQYANAAAAAVIGKQPADLLGMKCYQVFKTEHCGTDLCACQKAVETGEPHYAETIGRPTADHTMDIGYSGAPVRDRNGEIIGALEIATDITEGKTTQRTEEKRARYQEIEVAKLVQNLERLAGGNLTCDMSPAPADEETRELHEVYARISEHLHESVSTIRSTIDDISNALGELSAGNLDVSIDRAYRGDFLAVKESINAITASLNEAMGRVNAAAEQVAAGTSQVSDGSQALSQGATEQAAAIEELNASVAHIAEQTRQNAVNAEQASHLTKSARQDAQDGTGRMQAMVTAMDEISEASANIHRIIKVIDDIAFQTNLLALNAAVEAARAGQQGKGFAVVAEEVRSLAARSAAAARETTDMIETAINRVQAGARLASETSQAFGKIVSDVQEASDLVAGIASASNAQATAAVQVSRGIEQVAQVVQTNSATAEESAATSEELSGQAELLKEMVGHFRLRGEASATRRAPAHGAKALPKATARPRIALEEGEFGKY